MNAVVIYYSLEGSTRAAAEQIAEELRADIIRLTTCKNYPDEGIMKFLLGGMDVFLHRKPKLNSAVPDLSRYDTVFLGTPVWAGCFAPPLRTLLCSGAIQKKTVYLFASHGGGGAEKCFDKMRAALDGNKVKGALELQQRSLDNERVIEQKITEFCSKLAARYRMI